MDLGKEREKLSLIQGFLIPFYDGSGARLDGWVIPVLGSYPPDLFLRTIQKNAFQPKNIDHHRNHRSHHGVLIYGAIWHDDSNVNP